MKTILQFGTARFVVEADSFDAFCDEVAQCLFPLAPLGRDRLCFMCNFDVFEEAAACETRALEKADVTGVVITHPICTDATRHPPQLYNKSSIHVYSQESFEAAEAVVVQCLKEARARRQRLAALGLIDVHSLRRLCSLDEAAPLLIEVQRSTGTEEGTVEVMKEVHCVTVPLHLLLPVVVLDMYMSTTAPLTAYYSESHHHHHRVHDKGTCCCEAASSSASANSSGVAALQHTNGTLPGATPSSPHAGSEGSAGTVAHVDQADDDIQAPVAEEEPEGVEEEEEPEGVDVSSIQAPEEEEEELSAIDRHRPSTPPSRAQSSQMPGTSMSQSAGPCGSDAMGASHAEDHHPDTADTSTAVAEVDEEQPDSEMEVVEEAVMEEEAVDESEEDDAAAREAGQEAAADEEPLQAAADVDEADADVDEADADVDVDEADRCDVTPRPHTAGGEARGRWTDCRAEVQRRGSAFDVALIVTGKPLVPPAAAAVQCTNGRPPLRAGKPPRAGEAAVEAAAAAAAADGSPRSAAAARHHQVFMRASSAMTEYDVDVVCQLLETTTPESGEGEAYFVRDMM